MSSRFVLGRSTKAKARLEALLRVIDWLTSGVTTADWTMAPSWSRACRPSRRASGCAADARGAASGAGGCDEATPPHPRDRSRREGIEQRLCDCADDVFSFGRNVWPTRAAAGP